MTPASFPTLDEFITRSRGSRLNGRGELGLLLRDLALAAKRVRVEVVKAGLVDILGDAGSVNVQGEEVKKLDLFANNQFMSALQCGMSCAGIASEELDEWLPFNDMTRRRAKYVCLFDPLDGSTNIDTNVSIGTIFSVYPRISVPGSPVIQDDFLQRGIRQVAAGYILYGSSTMLVFATRHGVNGFTLDPAIGEFCLSHPNLKCPETGRVYSVNHGHFFAFHSGIQRYITGMQQKNKAVGGPYSHRYVGSMVADMHRTLIKGGIFMYPGTTDHPNGKLRLLYECNPLAFVVTAAGGCANDGNGCAILEVPVTGLHQRTPFFAGSATMMHELEACMMQARTGHERAQSC